ncbi:MAG: YkgJ family cysteine cluster protein [Desulfobacterales bacterium]|nr:MAG: YkgJ family cysteine cluster protein [Desulfobacterales bacterium]
MDFDLTPYFTKYEALLAAAEEVFGRVRRAHEDCVKCKTKCADCCYALFDLTLIEALYLNQRFYQKFKGRQREALLEKTNRADRKIHKIKRKAYSDLEAGKPEARILAEMALERVRCPLLNEEDLCDLYECRPITCRFYGIPTSIGGAGHTCGKSGFEKGKKYPTVKLDAIHGQLQKISAELVRDLKSRYVKLADMLVPLSMALLTEYDEAYLGIDDGGDPRDDPRRAAQEEKR